MLLFKRCDIVRQSFNFGAAGLQCWLQAQDLGHAANLDPWQVAEHEASLAAGHTPAYPPGGVHLLKELEVMVEPESQGSTAASEEQPHMQQCVPDELLLLPICQMLPFEFSDKTVAVLAS